MRKTEISQGSGLEVLHENIGLSQHAFQQGLIGFLLQVEMNGLLAAIEPDEIRALPLRCIVIMAGKIAVRSLDFDDARAGIRHPAGAHGACDGLLKRNDQFSLQRQNHTSPLSFRLWGECSTFCRAEPWFF